MRKLCASFAIAVALSVPVMAGEIGTPGIIPPPPPPPATVPGATQPLTSTTTESPAGIPLTEALLRLLVLIY